MYWALEEALSIYGVLLRKERELWFWADSR
jgi:hypothetical protein